MGSLGTHVWTASVTEPGGRIVWASGMTGMEQFRFERVSSEASTASVNFLTEGGYLADRLEPWGHVLNVFADDELAWQGILTEVGSTRSVVTVEAVDAGGYLPKRRIPSGRRWDQADASRIMAQMVVDAMSIGDPLRVSDGLLEYPSRVWAVVDETANTVMLQDVVDDLVSAGLDWTVFAGRMIVGPGPTRHTTATLSDSHLGAGIRVLKDGRDVVTDVLVIGDGVWAMRAVEGDRLGIQAIVEADGLVTVDACERRAEEELARYAVAPRRVELDGTVSLSPESPVELRELIPGVTVPVSTEQTGVLVAADLSLDTVTVEGDSGGVNVSISLGTPGVPWAEREAYPPPPSFDGWSPYEKEAADKDHRSSGSDDDEWAQPGIPM